MTFGLPAGAASTGAAASGSAAACPAFVSSPQATGRTKSKANTKVAANPRAGPPPSMRETCLKTDRAYHGAGAQEPGLPFGARAFDTGPGKEPGARRGAVNHSKEQSEYPSGETGWAHVK